MRDRRNKNGFTLVELLVAMIVCGVILAAVATLAYAMGVANDVTGDMSQRQMQVRYATLRISQLLRHCKLVCGMPGDDIAIWRADDNADGQINITELVYIEKCSGIDYLGLCEFTSATNPVVPLSAIDALSTQWWLSYNASDKRTVLVPQCSNKQCVYINSPPYTNYVGLSFEVNENGIIRQYEICSRLHGLATHLLDIDGQSIVSDDD